MDFDLAVLRQSRMNFLHVIEGMKPDLLNHIPQGYRNNIIWNVGHIIVTHQLLCYWLSSLEPYIDESWIELFKKGTAPKDSLTVDEMDEIRSFLMESVVQFEKDLANDVFRKFQPYKTTFGVEIKNIDEAIWFNNVHESMHLGYILAMKNAVLQIA